jgi:hypothetical protein
VQLVCNHADSSGHEKNDPTKKKLKISNFKVGHLCKTKNGSGKVSCIQKWLRLDLLAERTYREDGNGREAGQNIRHAPTDLRLPSP